jgi:alkaline phosphatase D
MPSLTVGPVIGKVSHNTARVLVEVPREKSGEVRVGMQLADLDGEPSHWVPGFGGRPASIVFVGLRPDSDYAVWVEALEEGEWVRQEQDAVGRFRTPAKGTDTLRVAATSCNNKDEPVRVDLYEPLAGEGADVTLHLGDQVYADVAFELAMQWIAAEGGRGEALAERVLELFRDLYRESWSLPSVRQQLATGSNLMVLDDHEIRNDWGDRPEEMEGHSDAWWVGTLARRAYAEYQVQLYRDVPRVNMPPSLMDLHMSDLHHAHRMGNVGLMMLDCRAAKVWGPPSDAHPFLGSRQAADVAAWLAPGGLLGREDCVSLVVGAPIPLALVGGQATAELLTVAHPEFAGHWSSARHAPDRAWLLGELRRWRDAVPGRQITVLGGDLHGHMRADVRHNGTHMLHQVVCGAIRGAPNQSAVFNMAKAVGGADLGDGFTFTSTPFVGERNYVVLDVSADDPHLSQTVAARRDRAVRRLPAHAHGDAMPAAGCCSAM